LEKISSFFDNDYDDEKFYAKEDFDFFNKNEILILGTEPELPYKPEFD